MQSESKIELLSKLNRIQQLREALDHIDIVMGFLSAGGKEDGHMSLMEYASRVLNITDFNKMVRNIASNIALNDVIDWRRTLSWTNSFLVANYFSKISNRDYSYRRSKLDLFKIMH